MKVVLDTSSISTNTQSAYRYFSELIPRFQKSNEVTLELVPSPYYEIPKEWIGEQKLHKPVLPKGHWFPDGKIKRNLSKIKWAFEKKRLGSKLEKNNSPTIFHSFLYSTPPSKEVTFIPNALDLIVEKFGKEWNLSKDAIIKKQNCFSRADRILAISDNTKQDLIHFYQIDPSKIDVIYLAANESVFKTIPLIQEIEKLKIEYKLNAPFLLQVGGRMHHRNFKNLLEAFAISPIHKNYLLVSAGDPWSEEELKLMEKWNLKERVRIIPNPTDITLRNLYHTAEFLVYPSLYEGFGFPLIEAMSAGLPVVTSFNSGSIPEIAGNAAMYFDPKNPEDIAKKIEEMTDRNMQEDFIKKGYENSKRFSWDETARKTLESYRHALLDV